MAAGVSLRRAVLLAGLAATGCAPVARTQIHIVGSSTVFPFATAVAERFGQQSEFRTPVVEATGTGGGIKLFCEGAGENTPDIANASRPIKESELKACRANGVTPVEVKIGFDGIVIVAARGGLQMDVSREQLFRALASELPGEGGRLQPNPHTRWSHIDPSLPEVPIEVLGPPPTSGTYDAFVELVMEEACPKEMEKEACTDLREDGAYIEAGENDNLIVQKLQANPNAVGIFGFSFLDQNRDKLQAVTVGGVDPSFQDIASGNYPISRSLFFYLKREHVGVIPGLQEYALEFTSPSAWSEEGYLAAKGLIPLPQEERQKYRAIVEQLQPLALVPLPPRTRSGVATILPSGRAPEPRSAAI